MLRNFQVISIKVEKKVDLSTGLLYFPSGKRRRRRSRTRVQIKAAKETCLLFAMLSLWTVYQLIKEQVSWDLKYPPNHYTKPPILWQSIVDIDDLLIKFPCSFFYLKLINNLVSKTQSSSHYYYHRPHLYSPSSVSLSRIYTDNSPVQTEMMFRNPKGHACWLATKTDKEKT